MKKVISLLLALAMVMSLSITAFAAENESNSGGTGDYSAEVTGSYVGGSTTSETKFNIEITWTGMNFTYHTEAAPEWDTTNHIYIQKPAYWEGEGTITVTNHSNARIDVTLRYQAESGYEKATMSFQDPDLPIETNIFHLASAATWNAAQSDSRRVVPQGELPANTKNAKIGTINITIEHNTNVTWGDVQSLKADAEAREAAWKQAGFTSEASNLVRDINSFYERVRVTMNEGTFHLYQSEFNTDYAALKVRFDELEAKC